MWHSTYKEKNARTFFAGARLLATVAFFEGVALALPARTFLVAGALDLAAVFFAGGGLEALLVVETAFAVFVLVVTALDLEIGLLDLEAGLEVGLF
jgi:hypothetical protein